MSQRFTSPNHWGYNFQEIWLFSVMFNISKKGHLPTPVFKITLAAWHWSWMSWSVGSMATEVCLGGWQCVRKDWGCLSGPTTWVMLYYFSISVFWFTILSHAQLKNLEYRKMWTKDCYEFLEHDISIFLIPKKSRRHESESEVFNQSCSTQSRGSGDTNTVYSWWARATPLKNMTSSIGMMIPYIWENKKWQPNHQPDMVRMMPSPPGQQAPFFWHADHRWLQRDQTRVSSFNQVLEMFRTTPQHPNQFWSISDPQTFNFVQSSQLPVLDRTNVRQMAQYGKIVEIRTCSQNWM